MTDWLDPLGLGRVTDALSTGAAQSLVGRTVALDRQEISGRIAAVGELAPSNAMSSMLRAQLGLWRRLDVEFDEVRIRGHAVDSLRITARDVRATDPQMQRLTGDDITVAAHLDPPAVAAWLAELAPEGVGVRIDAGRLLARLPGNLARFGEVELEPYWDGVLVGATARHAWVRGRQVGLPERFQRRFEQTVGWLPTDASIESIEIADDGAVTIRGSVPRYEVAVDIPRLMTGIAARGTATVIDVLAGGR